MAYSVVNIHHLKNKNEIDNINTIYIGRGSAYGNPYSHLARNKAVYRTASRQESVEKYRQWLYGNIHEEYCPEVRLQILATLLWLLDNKRSVRFACYCAPKLCHGDVLVDLMRHRKWMLQRMQCLEAAMSPHKTIERFVQAFEFLSLEYPCKIVVNGLKFNNAYALYHALQHTSLNSQLAFTDCKTKEAVDFMRSRLYSTLSLNDKRQNALWLTLYNKFNQNPLLADRLLATCEIPLINITNDLESYLSKCWCVDGNHKGDNMLGKMLMYIRQYIKENSVCPF